MDLVLHRARNTQSQVLMQLLEVANRAEITHTTPMANIGQLSKSVDIYA